MKTKDLTILPEIGDLITFTEVWDEMLSNDGKYPHGIVTDIFEYDNLIITEGRTTLIGTLAFPLKDEIAYKKNFKVYVIRWASKDDNVESSFRFINEEWFHNKSFIVVQRSN